MDKQHLCESLITWLQTFHVSAPCSNVNDLTDGVAMGQTLRLIAPQFFTESWLGKIKLDAANNWRLKVSNLKKILKGILDYYSEVLGQHIQDFNMPDVNAIGEQNDEGELGRLLQLILGCAVNCDDKQEYIQRIMSMEESVQVVVMNAIQELMMKEMPANSDNASELKRTIEELNSVVSQKEEIAQRCHELDLQVAALQEERSTLIAETEKLNERLNQADSLEDPSTPAGRRYQQLQHQVESLQDDLYRMETQKDDFRIKVELQEKEVLELQQKNEELGSLAEEARTLKDEMDILRHTSDKVSKYEQTIETLKKRLDEMSDLKGQIRLLEEKNTSYMQTNMELEEEVRKSGTYKSQLEMYKRQVQELQMKISDETKRADKAEFECKRVQEKMSSVQREKERLVTERDSLKETNEELRCTQVQKVFSDSYSNAVIGDSTPIGPQSPSDTLQGDSDLGGDIDMLAVPPEIKERLIRLQHENKMLKLQQAESQDQQGQLLQTMLDDANARKNELESENRIANQRLLELEAQIEDLQESQRQSEGSAGEASSQMRRQLSEAIQKTSSVEGELRKKTGHIEELETQLSSNAETCAEMRDQLSRKDDEMRAMEERYKRYLEKAKSVGASASSSPTAEDPEPKRSKFFFFRSRSRSRSKSKSSSKSTPQSQFPSPVKATAPTTLQSSAHTKSSTANVNAPVVVARSTSSEPSTPKRPSRSRSVPSSLSKLSTRSTPDKNTTPPPSSNQSPKLSKSARPSLSKTASLPSTPSKISAQSSSSRRTSTLPSGTSSRSTLPSTSTSSSSDSSSSPKLDFSPYKRQQQKPGLLPHLMRLYFEMGKQ